MKIHITSLFDKNYLVRALALYNSLIAFEPKLQFWFLCLDDDSLKVLKLMNLKNVSAISLDELKDQELLETKSSRNAGEFAFTSKSAFIYFLFQSNRVEENDGLVFSDADILFFYSPYIIFNKMSNGNYSIGITPHKFPRKKKYLNKKVGKYNAGLIFFINTTESRKCVARWRTQCIEWCYLRYENGRLGDQMYLNDWIKKYVGVYEIKEKGVNLGSWNVGNYSISKKTSGNIMVDNEPLVCYHFHGLGMYLKKNSSISFLPISVYNDRIYALYVEAIKKSLLQVREVWHDWQLGFIKNPGLLRLVKQKIQKTLRETLK